MKARRMKKIVPILFAVGLCGMAFIPSYAQEHGEEVLHPVQHPAEQAVVHEQEPSAEQQHQVIDPAAGQSEEEHGASEAHGAEHAVAEHAEGHDAGHGEHSAPMLTAAKLKDLFWRALNFAALVFILVKFLARPLAAWLNDRRYRIQEELESMQRHRDEAEKAYKTFESRLAGMEGEMAAMVARAKAMAEEEKTRIIAEAEAAAEDIRRQAEASVQGALTQATKRLQAEIAEQAVVMAEELIVRNLTPEDQVAITEQYLERVGAVQ